MGFIILGSFLILLPILLIIFMMTVNDSKSFRGKGFGDRWTRSESFAFWLLFLAALTRGFLLFTPMILGLLLLAYGIARVANASLPLTEGIAITISLLFLIFWRLLWWIGKKKQATANPQPFPRTITREQAPPPLRLNTPYTSGKLTLTVHRYHKRQSFRPTPNRFQPGNQVYPETWFIEFDCTIQNKSIREIDIWAHLEEILPDNGEPHAPRLLLQFLPLSDDESEDIIPGSSFALASAKQDISIKGTVACKLFFRLDESMNLHTMAFFLHKSQAPYVGPPLFSIEV